ncbi:MAG: NfeD family protein [bacterium]
MYAWEVSYLTFTLGAAVVFLFNIGLALAAFRIMRRQPTTGQEGMIGQVGVVLKKEPNTYLVRVRGEIWKSESAAQLRIGEKVVVENIDGLNLTIRKC